MGRSPAALNSGTLHMSKSNLADQLTSNLNAQLELCTSLENLADNLPDNVDVQNCLMLADNIYPILQKSHKFEESVVFPELSNRFQNDQKLMETLKRLRFEHWEDESFAKDLHDSMVLFANTRKPESVDSLSYMLRGFFEGIRRHIAFELEYIAPLLVANDNHHSG